MIATVHTRTITDNGKGTQVIATAGSDSITMPWNPAFNSETNHATAAEVLAASYLDMPNARTDEAVKIGAGVWQVTVMDED